MPRNRLSLRLLSVIGSLALAGAFPSLIQASQVRTLSLEELTQRSGRVFSGRVIEVRVGQDPTLHQTVTRITFEVERGAKGIGRGRLTIKMLGDQLESREKGHGIEGVPQFAEGEEVVLFLYGESHNGLTSPVGFGQGKFRVVRDKQGRKVAINGFGNEHLFRGMSAQAKARLGKSAVDRWEKERSLPPDDLLDMVSRLQD